MEKWLISTQGKGTHSKWQLDGHVETEIEEEFDDEKYINTKHYWKKGYLGAGFQTYIDALDLVDGIEFTAEEKNLEKAKILNAR